MVPHVHAALHHHARSFAAMAPLLAAVLMQLGACERSMAPPQVAAAAPPDTAAVARGHRIATEWCASCHIVAPEQTRVANRAAQAPRFADVAPRSAAQPAALRHFMDELHLPMPTFRLWPPERDDVVAYIVSLAR